ncbi:MAG: insulinase family protein [Verrucomicrobiota bacterium]|nr:insulinase family protein [Chthoniobacterales bacterium]MDQ3413697.1 insulinase family protein [Verrucomicrobiota bacterium]
MKRFIHLLPALVLMASASSIWAIGGVDAPPAPSERHEVKFARPKETRLENGLRVIVAARPGLPLLAAQLLVRNGSEVDPEGFAGTASLTGDLLTKGTDSMSAPEIARAIESLGGSIDSGAGWDASAASVVVMSDKADEALKILADTVRHPAFKQEEIDRLKSQRLDGLRVALQQPGSLARFVTTRVVFGAGAYGHASGGTLETVQAIGRDQITQLYQKYYQPRNAAFILAGDITLEQGKAFAQKFFGDWKNGEVAPNEQVKSGAADWKPSQVVVDMPEAGQAAVTVARPAIERASPDYYAALVANAALGNGFVSRLNREIRIKRGLSYGAGSSLDPRREQGPFAASAQTKNQSAAEVAGLMESELKRLVSEPVQGEELKSRQAVLTGRYARDLETNRGFVSQISDLATYDLPLDTLDKYIPAVDAVASEGVTDFARKYLSEPTSLIIVGKAGDFLEPLKKSFPEVKVIEQKNLDLNQTDLTKRK